MTADNTDRQGSDTSAAALAFLHRLLCGPEAAPPSLPELLTGLAEVFTARAAGLRVVARSPDRATWPAEGLPAIEPGRGCHGRQATSWQPELATVERLRSSRLAVSIPRGTAGSVLATVLWVGGRGTEGNVPQALPGEGLLWLEDDRPREWTRAEAGVLPLAGSVLERILAGEERSAGWVEQWRRHARQFRLEAIAQAARRMAHDFGNVFTGILGFTELSLVQPSPGHALIHSYLREIFHSAQNGARLTSQLRLFSRRQQVPGDPCTLTEVVEEEVGRIQGCPEHAGKLRGRVGGELPPVAIDKDHLRHVVAAVLENAVEALPPQGEAVVSARTVELDPAGCVDYYGDPQPGPHVLLTVADKGLGLTVEGWQRVLAEPFWTTKPRHRGLGLAVAYGVLHAHRGGLRLLPRPGGGVLVEVLLPVVRPNQPGEERPAAISQGTTTESPGVSAPGLARGARVLVVDDDLAVLNYVRATLEQAGYEVQTVTSAEEALHSYLTGPDGPGGPRRFQLVLSDVVMPRTTGVELARQLLTRDTELRLLFMSSQVGQEFSQEELGHRFELLSKPFAREGLLRAVRSAIDRPVSRSAGLLTTAS